MDSLQNHMYGPEKFNISMIHTNINIQYSYKI